jgi:mRNA-decapping enzyme 1B
MSSITEEARRQANLKLLQKKCDSSIQSILKSATHVVLYKFENNTWSKCGIEGSSFLVATPNSVQLIILNRHSSNNFILNVSSPLGVQDQDPFLILQETQPTQRTSGLWFHQADERIAMTSQLGLVLSQLANNTFSFPAAPVPPLPLPPVRAPAPEVTQDERDHLSALLAQTAMAATTTARSASAPASKPPPPSPVTSTTPTTNSANTSSSSPQMPGGSVALDKKALQLTLLSLIQDERFLDLLHSQYLRVVHARAKKNHS